MEVLLIRHATGSHMVNPGLIIGRALNATLTPLGVTEALNKGHELTLRNLQPDLVYSSTAVRCVDTAKLILQTMGCDKSIQTSEQILEMAQGNAEGLAREVVYTSEVLEQVKQLGLDFSQPNGESMNDVAKRGTDWLKTLEQQASSTPLVFAFTHAGFITNTVGAIENWGHDKRHDMIRLVPPVSETSLTFENGVWTVNYFGRPLSVAE